MNTLEEILFPPKELFNVGKIAETVLQKNITKDLMELVFCNDLKLSNRALWVMSHCSMLKPNAIRPYYEKLILSLKNQNLSDAFKRNTLNVLSENEIPEKHHAFMLDICYQYLHNTNEAIAIRALCVPIIYKLSLAYPELLQELQSELQHLLAQENPPALLAKARIFFKKISKNKS